MAPYVAKKPVAPSLMVETTCICYKQCLMRATACFVLHVEASVNLLVCPSHSAALSKRCKLWSRNLHMDSDKDSSFFVTQFRAAARMSWVPLKRERQRRVGLPLTAH